MSRSIRWVGAALALVALAPACSTTEETPFVEDPYATESKFCEAFGKTVCNQAVVEGCYLSSAESLSDDTTSCVDAASTKASCNGSGLPYHREGAEACLKALGAAYADASLTQTELKNVSDACLAAFSKDGSTGESCGVDTDCSGVEGLRCVVKPGADNGTCQKPTIVGAGKSCAADNAVCDDGLFCHTEADACIDKAGVGEDCTKKPCSAEGTCNGSTCDAKLANGTDCTSNGECAGGFCVKAQGASSGKCGAQLQLTSTSTSCDPFRP